MKEQVSTTSQFNSLFLIHFILVIIAWAGPFVFPWYLMVLGYGIVIGQFLYYKRCLLNKGHGLDDSGDHTFYSHLFEKIGLYPDRQKLKNFVRAYLYILLAIFTLFLQLGLRYQPYFSQ